MLMLSGPVSFRSLALFAALAPLALLSACGGSGQVQSPGNRPVLQRLVPPPLPHRGPPPQARMLSMPGLEGVVGADARELIRQFGPARLDAMEGDARKLQFSGEACVLDVYLYPLEQGREPRATYVDARRATDGRDVDRAACVAALRGGSSGAERPERPRR